MEAEALLVARGLYGRASPRVKSEREAVRDFD